MGFDFYLRIETTFENDRTVHPGVLVLENGTIHPKSNITMTWRI